MDYIPFEKPIVDLETRIDELRRQAATQAISLDSEIAELESKAQELREQTFRQLTSYQCVQMSRHPKRPRSLGLIQHMCSDFVELHGDRNFYDDPAVIGGIAKLGEHSVIIVGHQKGVGTKDNIFRNFGMPRPEGYRKALRIMSMAERFSLPIVALIDTPGAYPGIGAEERGQSEAIGKNILVMARLKVPIVCVVVGEGGSGGALALGVGNRVHMLEYASYSVISPEGCASILLKDASRASEMAEQLGLTAKAALDLGVIDSIIKEPLGGAHRGPQRTAEAIKAQVDRDITELKALSGDELRRQRMNKFMAMGQFDVEESADV